jgi:hypothetical protein
MRESGESPQMVHHRTQPNNLPIGAGERNYRIVVGISK